MVNNDLEWIAVRGSQIANDLLNAEVREKQPSQLDAIETRGLDISWRIYEDGGQNGQ